MKKVLLFILSVMLSAGIAATVWATVIGTPHELASEPCAMCHTPHSGTGDYPLWNRTQEAVTYTVYDSISFDMGPAKQPRNPSRLCLVCHNGVLSELVNYPGPCTTTPDSAYDFQMFGCADLGTDLMNDHPLSFDYDSTLDKDGNVFPVATQERTSPSVRYAILGGISTTKYWLYGELGANKWFECTTCHSVHDLGVYPGKGDYQVHFLRNDNTGSTMCLDCHTAK